MALAAMRAIRVSQFGGPEVLKLACDVPVPMPAAKQVLVKVHSIGVNPVDTYIRSGNYNRLPESMPYTPGSDISGIIDRVGLGVTRFQPGDRVFTIRTISGGYAEYAVAEESTTFRLHEALSFQQGAALSVPYFTAFRALHTRGGVMPGETVLVHGASGAVGIAAVQLAKAHGCQVLGTAGSEKGKENILKHGAEKVFDHNSDTYVQEIKDFTKGLGVNMIVEMLANVNLQKDLQMLDTHGRVMVVGCRGDIEISPRLTMTNETDVRGVMLFQSSPSEFNNAERYLYTGVEGGWLRPDIGEEFPLDKASDAHQKVIEQSGSTAGKIILTV